MIKASNLKLKVKGNVFVDLPIITFQEDKHFISYVPFLYVTGIGKTRDKSIKDLIDGVESYFHGENAMKIIKEKLPMPRSPISLEKLEERLLLKS